jgi:4-amino-4-deoxy-L-arabinose transferase-like glycosyltransferase
MKHFKHYLNTGTILGLIFIGGLIFRIGIIYVYAWNTGLHYEFAEIARNIIYGYGYSWGWYGSVPLQPTAAFVPLYTYFLAIFMAVFEEPARFIYFSQAILNALGIYAAYLLVKHLSDKNSGLIAAGLYAFFPEIAYATTKMVPEAIISGPVLLAFYLFLKMKPKLLLSVSTIRFFWLGIFIGLLALMKASLLFLYVAFAISLLVSGFKRMPVLKSILLLSIGVVLAVSPWLIRNTIVMGKPVFRTTYGFNLWRGNYPGASGTGRLLPGATREVLPDDEYFNYIDQNQSGTEIEIDEFFTKEAIRLIKQNPGGFLKLTAKRIFYFLVFDPSHPLARNIIYLGGYAFAVVFGTWGAVILKRRKRLDISFVLVPLLHLFLYAPVMILPRYRMILVWLLVCLASIPLAGILIRFGWLTGKEPI